MLVESGPMMEGHGLVLLRHLPARPIGNTGDNAQRDAFLVHHTGLDGYCGVCLLHMGCGHLGAPHFHMGVVGVHQPYIAVKAGTRIPTAASGAVLEPHGQHIVFAACIQQRCDIHMERIVAKRPEYGLLAVDIHTRLAHGSVKHQCGASGERRLETCAIPPYSHIR